MRAYTNVNFALTPTAARAGATFGGRTQVVIGSGADASPLSLFATKAELKALMLALHDVLAAMPADDDEVTL